MRLIACRRLVALLALAPLASGVVVGQAMAAKTRPTPAPQYLFSIPTASGSLTGRNDTHLTLTLVGTRNYLTRFTDRPLRQAFVVANVDFAKRFEGYFGRSKPNAVLTYTPAGSSIPVSIVVTIGQPRWSAPRSTWTFPAIRIRKQPDNLPGTSVHIKPPVIPNPRSFTNATLLIDDTTASCPSQPYASCPNADLQGAYLYGANLIGANFSGADLSGAWAPSAHFYGANFDSADLTGANLIGADLSWAHLDGTNVTGADLTGDKLVFASLYRANLTRVGLSGADLSSTDLVDANLTGAELSFANLSGADLAGADLTGADLVGANLTAANICQTQMYGSIRSNPGCSPPP